MARSKLTDRAIRQAKRAGVLIDGKGLRLKITANPTSGALRKNWVLRVKVDGGQTREIGLGSPDIVALETVRKRAQELRELARSGVDPIAYRAQERAQKAVEAARTMTFRQCAEAYIEAHKAGWKNAKHAKQWPSTFESYAYPIFGGAPVADVDQAMVMRVLEPLWAKKMSPMS